MRRSVREWWSNAVLALAAAAAVALTGCAAAHRAAPGGPAAAEVHIPALDAARESARRGAHGEAAETLTAALADPDQTWTPGAESRVRHALASAHLWLGQHRQALAEFQRSLDLAEGLQDPALAAQARGQLGNTHLALGERDEALALLEQAEAEARRAGDGAVLAAVLNNRGNALAAGGDPAGAGAAYRESASLAEAAGDALLAASALANGARLALEAGRSQEAAAGLARAVSLAQTAPGSQAKAHVLVTVGAAYAAIPANGPKQRGRHLVAGRDALERALRTAEDLPDPRTLSYAWGELGALYWTAGHPEEARQLTERAVAAARRAEAPESLYRWEWQLARLLRETEELEPALAAYGRAVDAVGDTRQEASSCYSGEGAAYRRAAAPLYQEWVDLLLQRAGNVGAAGEPLVRQAREAVEVLRVFELQDYFQDDCVAAAAYRPVAVDEVARDTAVLYVVDLPERTELLVSLPDGMRSVPVPVAAERLRAETLAFRRALENRTTWGFLPHAQQLYRWIVGPVQAQLEAQGVRTLVFVPSGPLRGVPLAALHDGERFLVERYATGVIPGLNLADPRPLDPERLRVLSLGLTEAVQGFPGLPHVAEEFRAIRRVFGGRALVDGEFEVSEARAALADPRYGVVHVASHAQFGDTPQDTFLLAYDGKITLGDLGAGAAGLAYRERPLELLTLSACETAAGDEQAALGLAGVAVKAGARSAVATLWTVSDLAAAELIGRFYRDLGAGGMSRAAALQDAQQTLLADPRYDHPAYWAPFVLINNWL